MRGIVATAAAAAIILTGTPALAAAEDNEPPEIHSVELSKTSFVVRGLQTETLTVTAHLTDETAVNDDDSASFGKPFTYVQLGGPSPWVRLQLASGTLQDGIFTGSVEITSEWRGDYRVNRLVTEDWRNNELTINPSEVFDLPTISVTSSGRPVMTQTISPDPVFPNRGFTQTVRVTVEETGQPYARVPVKWGYDNACAEDYSDDPDGYTDANGRISKTYPAGPMYEHLVCAWVPVKWHRGQPGAQLAGTSDRVRYKYVLTARPASASVPAGTNVAVTGTLTPAQADKEVELQRLYPGNRWTTVNRGKTNGRSQFSIVATPPGKQTYSYRVFAAEESNRDGNTSPTFTITGR